jgi:ferric iron reductase protein FhuF
MHDITLWAAWYVFLLAIPLLLIGSLVRERLVCREPVRRHRNNPE